MNPLATFKLSVTDNIVIGDARFIITRRKKLDRKPNGNGPKLSKDVRHQEVLNLSMTRRHLAHIQQRECSVEIDKKIIEKLLKKHKADLLPNDAKMKNMLCVSIVITSPEGEILLKLSKLLTA